MSYLMPENCAKQWEVLLLLIASEEKKIDRTNDSETDTMRYFLDHPGINQILHKWIQEMHDSYARKTSLSNTAQKCDDVSLNWRETGNEKFKTNEVEDSYECYTNSVLFAFQNGPKYPLALANRSAALLRLKRYEECLKDIERAKQANYPDELHYKLLLREADCYIHLNKRQKAIHTLKEASQQAQIQKLTEAQVLELNTQLKILQRKLDNNICRENPPEPVILPECYKGENPDFVSASAVLALRHSDTEGRHVVTKEALKRGDVVFSEEPYAWVLLPSPTRVCDGCCATDFNLVPCKTCSRVFYCSESCRSNAISYHQYECSGGQADIFATIGIAHLALRVVLKSMLAGFPKVLSSVRKPRTASDMFRGYTITDFEIYKKGVSPFYRMFNLITNFEKMNVMDYMQYAVTATMLTIYLERFTDFFNTLPSKIPYSIPVQELRLFVGSLLLRSLGQLVCNGHATLTLEVEDDGSRTMSEHEVRRATAIYPSAAMMNHSCDPNIVNTFYKCRIIIRCGREIPAGGQVLNCYGPHKARDTTSRRRQLLRAQYLFTCSCTACLDMEHRDFVLLFSAYACSFCKGPVVHGHNNVCPQCRAPFYPQKIDELKEESQRLLSQASNAPTVQRSLEKALAAFKLQQQMWYRHNSSLRKAADNLARLYAENGDFGRCVELIKQNIQSLEYQFGSISVEVAHELRKLADAMLERIHRSPHTPDYRDWCLETHKIIKKAIQLMELNYGRWTEAVRRLEEQEASVSALLADTGPLHADNVHHTLHYNLKI